MATAGTDMELNDLLDFTLMFPHQMPNGKSRGPVLPSSQFGLDERSGPGPWAPGEPNSPSYTRAYDNTHYSEHDGMYNVGIDGKSERGYQFGTQPQLLSGEIGISGSDGLSPPAMKAASQFYPYITRRRVGESTIDPPPKKIRKVPPGLPSSVYPGATGEDYNPGSTGYPGSKAGNLYPGSFFVHDGLPDHWGPPGYSPVMSNSPHIGQPAPFTSINTQKRQPLPLSPQNYPLHGSEVNLPSSFQSTSVGYGVPSHTPPINGADSIMVNRGGNAGSSGAEIGKALASIYSPDNNGNTFPSNPSTPVGSPSNVAASASQWPKSSSQPAPSPGFVASLQAQSKLDDRLGEALHVLRNHAVGGQGLTADMQSLLTAAVSGHPAGAAALGSISQAFGLSNRLTAMMSNLSDDVAGVPTSAALLQGHHAPHQAPPTSQSDTFTNLSSALPRSSHSTSSDIKREDKEDDENLSIADKSEDEKKDGKSHTRTSLDDEDDDEDLPIEVKAEREKERRVANNARERLRVRDINEAFKELGRMCQMHMNNEKPQTKLLVLHQAVNIILNLEQQVRERNLNPKAACLKRREEEKVTGDPPMLSGLGGDGHSHM
ncbi:transcription factor E2-alpha-like isoform X1 [Myxocyprinus asiaticus]|uniref:transcription factor E2-alpha-like isoform X1 n=1 Tax=Myxocyprinus asiaticus TaxID=70543 RepID=UPI002221651F|nr:transcription factor E2-alpha-like isoform X1 [Myxocyprinus asiaticus]